MLPDPLHPAVVHLPVALMVLLPLFALGALWTIRRGTPPLNAWSLVVGLTVLLLASSWVAVETGEQQEDIVEAVVSEGAIHTHEEAAELFFWMAGGVLLLAGAGLVRGKVGATARLAATAATLALVVAGWRVGHTGGELVYVHGAAAAYVDGSAADRRISERAAEGSREADEGEHGDRRR